MTAITTIKPRGIDITGDYVVNSISSAGNVSAGNIKTDNLLYANGTAYVFTTNASGSNTQVQFNDGNSFAGDANLTFDKTTGTLTVAYLSGNGSQLTGLPASYTDTDANSAIDARVTTSFIDNLNVDANTLNGHSDTYFATSTQGNLADTALQPADLTGYATETYVGNAVANLVNAAPGLLDTLGELANAIGNDASFTTTITNSLANKANTADLSTVALSGNYEDLNNLPTLFDGEYSSLANTPSLFDGTYANLTGKPTLFDGEYTSLANTPSLFSGSYLDLTDTPTMGNIITVNLDGNSSNILYGNGVFAGASSSYGDSNVAAYLPTYTGNITAGNISVTGNVTANSISTTGSGGNLSGANWIIANYFSGSGNNLSDIQGANVSGAVSLATYATTANSIAGANVSGFVANANVANTAYAVAAANVTGIGNIATINKDGNASNILYGNGVFASAPVTYANSNVATFLASFGSNTITTTGNVTVGNIIGNGQALTGLTGANVTGAVSFATTANAVAGANVSGQVSNALVAGTVYTNAQPNITSLGVLTGLEISGNITPTSNVTYDLGNNTNRFRDLYLSGNTLELGGGTITIDGNSMVLTNPAGGSFVVDGSNAAYASIASYVTEGIQANITQVGTLSNLSVTGNVEAGNILTDSLLYANGDPYQFSSDLANLTDVVLTSAADGDVLSYDTASGKWINTIPASGGGSSGGESTITSVDAFTGDGIETVYTLSVTPGNINQTFINYNGALQLRSSYTLSGAEITFSEAPANGSLIEVTTQMNVTSGSGNLTVRNYVADGVQVTYAVSSGVNATNILVTENGLVQTPTTDYTVSAGVLTFISAPGSGVKIQIRELGVAVSTITPVGSNTQILFNDAGSFGHSANFTYNNNTSTLSVPNLSVTGNIIPTANILYDLGSPTNSFKDLYLSGSTIHLGGATMTTDATTGTIALVAQPSISNPNPTALVITSTGATIAANTTGGNIDFNSVANTLANTSGFSGSYNDLTNLPSKFINMVQPGNITTPFNGVARCYPTANITITNVYASLGTTASDALTFRLLKNNTSVGTYSFSSNSYRMTTTTANISVTTSDYLTLNVTSGTGATDLKVDLQYVLQ